MSQTFQDVVDRFEGTLRHRGHNALQFGIDPALLSLFNVEPVIVTVDFDDPEGGWKKVFDASYLFGTPRQMVHIPWICVGYPTRREWYFDVMLRVPPTEGGL